MKELGQRKKGSTDKRKGVRKQNWRSRRREKGQKKCLLHTLVWLDIPLRMTLLPCIQWNGWRGKKNKERQMGARKVGMWTGDKDKLVSNKSTVVTKWETNADMQLGRISHYRILFGVKMCSMKIFWKCSKMGRLVRAEWLHSNIYLWCCTNVSICRVS